MSLLGEIHYDIQENPFDDKDFSNATFETYLTIAIKDDIYKNEYEKYLASIQDNLST